MTTKTTLNAGYSVVNIANTMTTKHQRTSERIKKLDQSIMDQNEREKQRGKYVAREMSQKLLKKGSILVSLCTKYSNAIFSI